MSKTLIAIAVLAICVGSAEANGSKVQTATRWPTAFETPPACTASSSLFEVLGGSCFLVKGSMIYDDIADLSQINTVGW
ncbi:MULTISPECIES: hypothetical protein [unclassified Mesorhizobium]|uniref:hypothetical protein n=1 Tax=unclassified Mesorhizobium TaxID=325217 RepID=UPI000F75B435|nr:MULTISPECIES: hypothetical protein [unclassified Mesorhizobium]AZO09533.1 hypothetical protein EJ074_10730 [Mesorhizobium sp. M3A.F.Ca.ET.080.04.2.1]RWB66152.1 MAG: hypothetical protein EOQ49_29880 [Mesorhizobium sp.]RWB81994.1 MAG: hypothetical protein EOQ52_29010 [Mesorhizobium sp.]RWE38078.1 MAG: hypothetical protein EOS77_00225 [Mesorhizobium sp.]RWF23975.1 MAG: hypothetical protein EOS64_09445 [Mesorhizobium sp.]